MVRTLETFMKCTWLNGPSSVLTDFFKLLPGICPFHLVTFTSFHLVPPSPSLLLECFKKISDWNSHILTTNSKEDGYLISGVNVTGNQCLYIVDFMFPRGPGTEALSELAVHTHRESLTRKWVEQFPIPMAFQRQMLTLAWQYIVLNGIFTHPSQCLSIRVWIPLPLSRSS